MGLMACPAGTIRGPSIQPMSMAFMRATSSRRPPVCTNSPRFRTVVKPARRVRRALAAARSVFRAGSSCTGTSGLAWLGPPMTRLTSMSISPGSMVTSPRSIGHGVGGHRRRRHRDDPAPVDQEVARLDQRSAGYVEHAGTDQMDGGRWRPWSCHVGSFGGKATLSSQRYTVSAGA